MATILDYVFRVGGEGGEGVISTGELLSLTLARSGFEIYTFMTYPAEIKGGHANYQVRVCTQRLLSQGDQVDVLVAFNEEAYRLHAKDVKPDGGVIIFDSDSFTPAKVDKPIHYAVPMSSLATEKVGVKLTKNIVSLGVVSRLFDISMESFKELLKDRFQRKGDLIVQKNQLALKVGADFAKSLKKLDSITLGKGPRTEKELVLSGNESFALGAITAGCRIYAGYPITPATDIMEFLAKELPKVGGTVVQTEDEIAAVGVILGASFAGKKAMTATSGPGFSLMTEMLGLAVTAEIPVVIVNVQRVGPSTGMPTKTEQGDLYLAVYGGHGNCPRIVLALSNVQEAFYDAIHAFNLAEQFQMPVIVLSDQYLGHRRATVPVPDPKQVPVVNRRQPEDGELTDYLRYRFTPDHISAMAIPGIHETGYVATGLEHDESGYPAASNHSNHLAMTRKRYGKFHEVEVMANAMVKIYGEEQPEIGIIGWGSTEGVIREAVNMAKNAGYSVGALHPKIVYPQPLERVRKFMEKAKAVIIPEVNFTGQFATLLRKRFAYDFVQLNKCVGLPFTPKEIFDKIEEVAKNVHSGRPAEEAHS